MPHPVSPVPGVAAPDLTLMFEQDAYFQPAAWFYRAFGQLPRQLSYQLASAAARQQVLTELAQELDVEAATVARLMYVEKAGQEPEIGLLALQVAPHLLLLFQLRGIYGERGAHLYYSPEAEPATLQRLQTLLAGQLEIGQQERQRIHVLRLAYNELEFTPLDIKVPELDLTTHYNDDLLPAHDTIVRRLQQPQDKGIVILHGPPGTGKTSYIRQLCGLTDKPKLFIPPSLAARIADPEFINLLHDNTNSILIIEDAEALLTKRDAAGGAPSAVSNLLNLSDGLLADGFHIQIVCTFNTDLGRIDSALLRKGRLIAAYHFQPLQQEKAQNLATALGQTEPVTEPMALADIFNRDVPAFDTPPAVGRIGFSR